MFNLILTLTLTLWVSTLSYADQTSTFIQGPALIESETTTATATGTTTLTVSSKTRQVFTGSTTQTMVMPDATTLQLGRAFKVTNNSTGNVTVNANGGGLLQIVYPNSSAEFVATSVGTSAGTWAYPKSMTSLFTAGSVIFSDGSSFAQDNSNLFFDDTNNRLGVGTTAPSGRFHVEAPNTSGTAFKVTAAGGMDPSNLLKFYFGSADGLDYVKVEQGGDQTSVKASGDIFFKTANITRLTIAQAGEATYAKPWTFSDSLNGDIATDSTTTGANQTLSTPAKTNVRVTNASLISIDGITAPAGVQKFTLHNVTGTSININDETGATAANRIRTGSGGAAAMADNSSLIFEYDTTSSRWRVVGGSGGGGAGTVTSVALSVPATSILSVTGSPITTSGTLALATTGTSGGIPYFSSTSQLTSSGLLTANAITLGGGAGSSPTSLGSLGTTTTVLHGNASGAPTFGAVSLTADVSGTLPIANGGTGQTTANAALNAFLPTQSGNADKVLKTDGTNTSWITNGAGISAFAKAATVGASGCTWSGTTATTWTDLPTNASCNTATVTSGVITATTPTTAKTPAFNVTTLAAGTYLVYMQGATGSTADCAYRLSDGTNISGTTSANNDRGGPIMWIITYGSEQASLDFRVQYYKFSGTGCLIFNDNVAQSFEMGMFRIY